MPIIKEDPYRRYNPTSFSFDQVKGDVTDAMQFDWKRDKVDDAKKRAIYDSKNYDDFKQRVAGCTLKPIHRNEFNEPPKYAFNRQAPSGAAGDLLHGLKAEDGQAGGVKAMPLTAAAQRDGGVRSLRNGREFERELRRCATPDEVGEMVKQLEDSTYKRLFGREVDAEVLRRLLVAFDEASSGKGIPRGFLSALAAFCPDSTAMAATFLTGTERAIIARLLAQDPATDPSDDVRICAAFGVPPSSVAAAAADFHRNRASEPPSTPRRGGSAEHFCIATPSPPLHTERDAELLPPVAEPAAAPAPASPPDRDGVGSVAQESAVAVEDGAALATAAPAAPAAVERSVAPAEAITTEGSVDEMD